MFPCEDALYKLGSPHVNLTFFLFSSRILGEDFWAKIWPLKYIQASLSSGAGRRSLYGDDFIIVVVVVYSWFVLECGDFVLFLCFVVYSSVFFSCFAIILRNNTTLVSLLSAYHAVPCGIVVTCWERAVLMAFLCVMFSWGFVTFPYCVLGQV